MSLLSRRFQGVNGGIRPQAFSLESSPLHATSHFLYGEGGARVTQRLEVEADALLELGVRLAAESPRPVGLGVRREALAIGRELAEEISNLIRMSKSG